MLHPNVKSAVFALGLTVVAPCAHAEAPSDDTITGYLNSVYKTPINVADYQRYFAGDIGTLKDVVVIGYSLVYPGGDHGEAQRSSQIEAFTTEDDRLKMIPMLPIPGGHVDSVSVRDGKIYVETKAFRETDQPCCPSEPRSIVFHESDGVLTNVGD